MNPTTRSWTPPRTFLTQARFLQPGEISPRPGSPAPPSGRENAGQKGQKSRPPGQLSGRPGGPPRGPVATPVEAALAEGQTRPSGGPEYRPGDHPKPREATAPPRRKYRGISPPQPTRQSARPVLKIPSKTSSRPPEHAAAAEKRARSGPGRRGLPHAQPGQGEKRGSGQPAVRRPAPGGGIEQPAASAAGGTLQRVLRPVDEDVAG